MRVLIIGAGLGGLCLAHGLLQAGVDVAVFERSPAVGAQPASYGIHLNADGLRALHAALPPENWQRFVSTTVPARNLIRFHDPLRGVLATLDFETPENATDPVTRRRAVSRGNLRDALLMGLDGAVQWDQRFVSYTELPDGQVQATFEDGSRATGDLLVGADGSNSRVRAQRLPNLQRLDLGILNVAGRLPVTPEVAAFLPPELQDSAINNVVPAGPGWLFLSTWATGDSGSAATVGSERSGRYIVWAWAARRSTYPRGGEGLDGAALKTFVQAQVSGWAAPYQRLIEATRPEDIGPVPLRSMPQLPEWRPSRVTLLGDAVHNMTPMGGIGANTALRDAETLRQAAVRHPRSALEIVAEYERCMRVYVNAALALSTRNARRATDPSPIGRGVFRTLLKVAEAVPPAKRHVFHTPVRTVN